MIKHTKQHKRVAFMFFHSALSSNLGFFLARYNFYIIFRSSPALELKLNINVILEHVFGQSFPIIPLFWGFPTKVLNFWAQKNFFKFRSSVKILQSYFMETVSPIINNFLAHLVLCLFSKVCLGLLRFVGFCRFHICLVRYHSLVQICSDSDKRGIFFTRVSVPRAISFFHL